MLALRYSQSDRDLIKYLARSRVKSGCVHSHLRDDREFLMHLASSRSIVRPFGELRHDKELALRMIENQEPILLQETLRDNRQLMLTAVKRWGLNGIKLASASLRNDLEVAVATVPKDPSCSSKCSDELKNNFDLVMMAVKSDGLNIRVASLALRDNLDIALAAVESFPPIIYSINEELRQ